jgi:hypothetical protein
LRAQQTFLGKKNDYAPLCDAFDSLGLETGRIKVDSSYLRENDLDEFVKSKKGE